MLQATRHVLLEGVSDDNGQIHLTDEQKALLSEKYSQNPMNTWLVYPGQATRINVETEQPDWTDEDKLLRALNATGVTSAIPASRADPNLQPVNSFAEDVFSTTTGQLFDELKK